MTVTVLEVNGEYTSRGNKPKTRLCCCGYINRKVDTRIICFVTISFTVICIGLITALLVQILHPFGSHNQEICVTESCTLAAAELLSSMDQKLDPCEDFYGFVCGGWRKNHPIPDDSLTFDVFDQLQNMVGLQLRGILDDPKRDKRKPFARKVFTMYDACMNTTSIEAVGLAPLQELLRGLGGWPLSAGSNWLGDKDPVTLIAAVMRMGYETGIVSLSVTPDMLNATQYILMFDQPKETALLTKNWWNRIIQNRRPRRRESCGDDFDDDIEREARADLMRGVAKLLGNNDTDSMDSDLDELFELEMAIEKLSTARSERRNYTRMYNKMTITELTEFTNKTIDWRKFLAILFNGTADIGSDESVVVMEMRYISGLPGLLGNFSKRVLINHIIWSVIFDMLPHTTADMEVLLFHYDRATNGAILPIPRWELCLEIVGDALGFAVGRLFVEKFMNMKSKKSADEFVKMLESAFADQILSSSWMNNSTKHAAMKKVKALREFIGFPEWIYNDTRLNTLYENVTITNQHFDNVVRSGQAGRISAMWLLRQPVDKDRWPDIPTQVNAFYDPASNSISFPAAILQGPFFDAGRPPAMNFGAIGAIIGHEIGHGFDRDGSQFDGDGILREWWDGEAAELYAERSSCIVSQYDMYCPEELKDLNRNKTCVDGENTLGENMADNSGIRCAFKAYQRWISKKGREMTLPGLEKFTQEQIFFLSYGHIWCSNIRKEYIRVGLFSDPHSPSRYRVQGALANFAEFADAFNCPVGPMNRGSKSCNLW